jgi:hypothetical protein
MDQCEETLQHSDHILRRWLRSQRRDHLQQAPFEIPGRKATRIRYRSLWKRTICYFLRIHLLQGQFSHEAVALRLTDVQREEIQHLWHQSLEALHSERPESFPPARKKSQSQSLDCQLFPNSDPDTAIASSTSARRSPLPRFETKDGERGKTRSYAGRPVQSRCTTHVVAANPPQVLTPQS